MTPVSFSDVVAAAEEEFEEHSTEDRLAELAALRQMEFDPLPPRERYSSSRRGFLDWSLVGPGLNDTFKFFLGG